MTSIEIPPATPAVAENATALRHRWPEPSRVALRNSILERGANEDAAVPDGPWEEGWEFDLRGIDLSHQQLVGLDLELLAHANLAGATLRRCRLSSADLSFADLEAATLVDGNATCCVGEQARFVGMKTRLVDFMSSHFHDSDFRTSESTRVDWHSTHFLRCEPPRRLATRRAAPAMRHDRRRMGGRRSDGCRHEDVDSRSALVKLGAGGGRMAPSLSARTPATSRNGAAAPRPAIRN